MADHHEHGLRDSSFSSGHFHTHYRRDSRHRELISDKVATTPNSADGSGHLRSKNRKRFPESLHFTPSSFRLRSGTASTRSSISSANIPDSATTYSLSTLASPISTSYTSDISELFAAHVIDISRPAGKILHRHKPSTGTCSTYVNDEDDGHMIAGYPDLSSKIRDIRGDSNESEVGDDNGNDTLPVSPSTESPPIKEEEGLTPGHSRYWQQPPSGETATASKWESSSTASDDFSSDEADTILDFALQVVYGVDLQETSHSIPGLRQLVSKFVGDVGRHIWHAPSDAQPAQVMSSSSSSSTPSQGGAGGGIQGGGKRKKQTRGEEDEGEFSDGEGSGLLPLKRCRPNPKEDENLRLSCPFRKRNPQRFNVRDHHSCAMTYFPKFAELRQHIVKQHKRDDPSAFVCDRCNRDFSSRKELRDHQRQPKELMCDISDHDPESGVDGTTSNKLLSRKRVSGASPESQWKEIWNILFPDDEDHHVVPYYFTPVIEHFELSSHYLSSFDSLQLSLRDKISNPATLETLSTKFQQCFIEAVERCISSAQDMPYVNRSNKRNEPARGHSYPSLVPRKGKEVLPRPDSGVVMMDDASEESGSVRYSAFGPRDSVRTIVKGGAVPRRGSNLAPDSVREILPVVTPATSNMFVEDLMMGPFQPMPPMRVSVTGPMDPAAVQQWSNEVLFQQHQLDTCQLGVESQFGASAQCLTPQPELGPWGNGFYPVDFNGLGARFTGFDGGRTG